MVKYFGEYPELSGRKRKVFRAIKKHIQSPKTKGHLVRMVRHATRLGVDLNDTEIMGTWFDDIRKKIKGIAKKTKSVQLTTDRGTAQLGPGGVTWTDQAATSQDDSSPQVIQSSVGGMADMLKNPLVIGAGVSILALMLSKKGGKR